MSGERLIVLNDETNEEFLTLDEIREMGGVDFNKAEIPDNFYMYKGGARC